MLLNIQIVNVVLFSRVVLVLITTKNLYLIFGINMDIVGVLWGHLLEIFDSSFKSFVSLDNILVLSTFFYPFYYLYSYS